MRRLVLLFAAAALLAGCPTVKLSSFGILDGSVTPTSLTFAAQVEVEETEEVNVEEGTGQEGRAFIAVFIPRGWTVSGARAMSPQESTPRALIPAAQSAVQLGEMFPQVEGEWWAFASNTQSVATGKFLHGVELDVTFPKKSKGTTLGVTAGIFQDKLEEVPSPTIYDLAIKGKKATLTVKPTQGGALPGADPAAGSSDKASAG